MDNSAEAGAIVVRDPVYDFPVDEQEECLFELLCQTNRALRFLDPTYQRIVVVVFSNDPVI